MSDVIGPVSFNSENSEVFLGRDYGHVKEHSEETAQLIDSEIRRILMTANQDVERILSENINILHKGSKILLERETIDGIELNMIVKGEELPPISNMQLQALKNIKFNGTSTIENTPAIS
jgi:cell division protease FtsH